MLSSPRRSHNHVGGGRHSSSSISQRLHDDPTSFLFAINELHVRETVKNGDGWHNREPPEEPMGFEPEIPSCVMRYQSGQVTVAREYEWRRGDVQGTAWPPGGVFPVGAEEQLDLYKQLAVFSCNPHLPIAVLNGDPLSARGLYRSPLFFFHPPTRPGLSQATHPESVIEELGPGMCKYVAGSNPSWIPSLVPKTYRNPYNPTDRSSGLGGELPIILGLMAFSGPRSEQGGSVEQTFLGDGGRWRGGRWHHSAAPQGYALSAEENPRGFLVSIYYDPVNEYSTGDYIYNMEWRGPIVRDHH